MNIEKHKNFVQEMMVTFSGGKVDEFGNPVKQEPVPGEVTEPAPAEPIIQVDDTFNNSVNDMIKDFGGVNDMVSPATAFSSVETLTPETSSAEMEVENNQIGFEFADGKLHISIDGTDVFLGKDAIAALKDYLNNIDEGEFEEADDSEEESEEDSEPEEESDDSEDEEASEEDDSESEEEKE